MRSSHKCIALAIAISALALVGCNESKPHSTANIITDTKVRIEGNTSDLQIICLDGVKYWSGHYRLTPYIKRTTLEFERCKV